MSRNLMTGGRRLHIGLDGSARKCKAYIKECPLGADHTHFDDVDSAMRAADRLNKMLSRTKGVVIVSEKAGTVASVKTQYVLARLANMKYNAERLKNVAELAKKEVRLQMEQYEIKSIPVGSVATVTASKGYTQTRVSKEKLDDLPNAQDYYKDVEVKEKHNFSHKGGENAEQFHHDMTYVKRPEGGSSKINIQVDENGKLVMDEETEDRFKRLVLFNERMNEALEADKKLKNDVAEAMRKANIKTLYVGKNESGVSRFDIVDGFTRKDPDIDKLKADGVYDSVTSQSHVRPSLKITKKRSKKE